MDPVSALQVASAVIGIVDFGTRLLSDTYEIYQSASGHTTRDVELTTLSDELTTLGEKLQSRLQGAPDTTSSSEATLRSLSARCIEASAKLKSAIEDLRLHSSGTSKISTIANSFVSALKAVWKKSEIEALKENLAEIRSQITIAALVSVWEEAKQHDQRHIDLRARLDLIASKLDRPDGQFAKELTQMTALANSKHLTQKNAELINILWGIDWKSWPAGDQGGLFDGSQNTNAGGIPVSMRVLGSLSFPGIDERKEAITEAYSSTFSWIFRDEEVDENGEHIRWPSFPEWLKERNDAVYWITGKPGSGKSTLMKYIFQNPQLRSLLKGYAGGLPLMVAGFFFWNPGSELAKSQEGLLRALLYQCLKARQDLIPIVSPQRWALQNILGEDAVAPEWTLQELDESFDTLCSYNGDRFQLALFIDGLDEFIEAENSPGILLNWIRSKIAKHHLKICVSSRPWNVFSDAFKKDPSLMMQDLTRRDIEHFVRTKFDHSPAFQELSEVFPDDTSILLKGIIEKAEGVFLWVGLVVQSLLAILVDTPSLSHLQEKLDEIPSDIIGMYNAIWRSIPAKRLAKASMILQICTIQREQLRLSPQVLWLATEDSASPQGLVNQKTFFGIHKVMIRVLNGHTRGICELSSNRVQFLHRSALDWMRDPSTWSEVCSKAPLNFEVHLNYTEAWMQFFSVGKGWEQFHEGLHREWDSLLTLVESLVDLIAEANHQNNESPKELGDRIFEACENANQVGSNAVETTGVEGFSHLHWVTSTAPPEHRHLEHSFAGYAAGVGLDDYVKRKLQEDTTLLIPTRTRVSILEHAIFESTHTSSGARATRRVSCGPRFEERLEIIRFILENSEFQYRTASGTTMRQALVGFRTSDRSEHEFIDEVTRLLELHDQRTPEIAKKDTKKGRRGVFTRMVSKLKKSPANRS
ncbi:hypothetical protein B0T10DRAFT_495277 [Thelonectria olida]|uniref:Nephrocystin 3-like N-terminal domain-containing protein n=1 Tax=Thelonectria olida TaxID=1576542 RepID=A0A9P8VX05_9HYPO|nr:hypothetical protein B0T10DRAFT_495277 [Thelonectria olida]